MKYKLFFLLAIIGFILVPKLEFGQIQLKADTSQVNVKFDQAKNILVPITSLQMKNPQLYKMVQTQWIEKPSLYYWNETNSVYLWWSAVKGASGFNIYRRREEESYQKIANNLKWPVDQNSACSNLQSLLPLSPANMPNLEYQHMRRVLQATVPQLFAAKEWPTCPPLVDKNAKQAVYDLSRLYHQLALVIGYGYFDTKVVNGETYYYKIKYLDESSQEIDFAQGIKLTAGSIIKITKPTGLILNPGDGFIRLHWKDPKENESVIGYNVYRSESAGGLFTRINLEPALVKDTIGLSNPIEEMYGFLDTLTQNYTKYYYKITARSPTGKEGPYSNVVSGMSTDLTPPKIPGNFSVNHTNKDTILIQWSFVDTDIKGNSDIVAGYRIYRYNDYNTAIEDTSKIKTYSIKFIEEHRSKPGIYLINDVDRSLSDGGLLPERAYWYRISCIDTAGNISRKSAALSEIIPDIEPPDAPHSLMADSGLDFIKIEWSPPDTSKKKNKDLAGYLIYRGICGDSIRVKIRGDQFNIKYYPLHLLKDINHIDSLSYIDRSIPIGSPICYRYSIKAFDKSQNLSSFSDSTCERLHDRTPPEKPVIISLEARNKLIKLEAVAPPIQDIGGFIVERSDSTKSNWKRIYPDSIQKQPVDCELIPVSIDSIKAKKVNYLSYTDTSVYANEIYWYRVSCFDFNINKSAPSPPISTFTFDITNYEIPIFSSAENKGSSVVLKWVIQKTASRSDFLGYIVFRSTKSSMEYRQISPPLKKEEFIDLTAIPGVAYWYKIQSIRNNGDRSPMSISTKITLPE